MGREETRVARIALPDGTPVWARISGGEELSGRPGGLAYSDTGFADRVEATVESLNSLVTGVARSLAEPLRAVRPDEVSVQFGIELTAKAGKVVGLLADGEAKAGITVTLTWNSATAMPYVPGDATDATDATRAGDPAGPAGGGRDGAPPGAAGHGGAGRAAAGGGA